MWQELRDYWLPMMLFVGTLVVATVLLVLVIVAPLVIAYLSWSNRFIVLFADDATVRRTSLACAIGLTVTAFVFFRPSPPPPPPKENSSKKSSRNTMAGA
jgi:hypothetical protein